MYNRFLQPGSKIIFTHELSDDRKSTVAACQDLCQRTGSELRAVHVCEPEVGSSVYFAHAYVGYSDRLMQAIEERQMQHAKAELDKVIQESLGDSVKFSSNVMCGPAVPSIISDAVSSKASLIMTSALHKSYKFVPKGFSTSIGLMSDSSVPVMVLPRDSKVDFHKKDLTVMLCDDLLEASGPVVACAAEFAQAIGCKRFVHAHIAEEEMQLKKYLNTIHESMALAQIPYDSEFSEDKIMDSVKQGITQKMEARMAESKTTLEHSNTLYEKRVLFGPADDTICQAVEECSPDIVIFGRHHMLHRKPLGIGKMSFRVMLEMRTPVLVVPV